MEMEWSNGLSWFAWADEACLPYFAERQPKGAELTEVRPPWIEYPDVPPDDILLA